MAFIIFIYRCLLSPRKRTRATNPPPSEWFGLVSAITTILILVFTEIIPKTLGTENWRSLMGFTARTIHVLIYLLYPVVVMSQWLTHLISRKKDGEATVSREEVTAIADMGEDEVVIDEDENKINFLFHTSTIPNTEVVGRLRLR